MTNEKLESYIEYFQIAKNHDYIYDIIRRTDQEAILNELGETPKGRWTFGDREQVLVTEQIERLKRLKRKREQYEPA